MDQFEKDAYYMSIAKVVASGSTCLYGNVGCVIVDKDNNIISTGCLVDRHDILNCRKSGFCSFAEREGVITKIGIPETCDYMFPEVDAILNADRQRLQGATLYLYAEDTSTGKTVEVSLEKTLSKIILSSGIKRIVLPKV